MKLQTEYIPLSLIVPDEHNPRELFEPSKLKSLSDSIKRFGIKSPLTLEKVGEKYRIIDGERRFRAAIGLKLTEVPAVVEAPKTEIERLIFQFHIQEQHEDWTPVEKAMTVDKIAKDMGLTVKETCDLLSITNEMARRYSYFAQLISKKEYQKNNIGLHWVEKVNYTKSIVKNITENVLGEKFDRNLEKKLESSLIERLRDGSITKRSDFVKLKDSFTKDPKSIKAFLDTDVTANQLFVNTKAKGAYHLRNLVNSAQYVLGHASKYLENPDVKPSKEQLGKLHQCARALSNLFNELGE